MATVLFSAALLSAETAASAERRLVLEIILNGRATGQVAEFIDRDGALFANAADLAEFGLVLPRELSNATEPIPLAALPGLRAQLDESRQTVAIAAEDSALQPTLIGGQEGARLTPLTRSEIGALLNYDTTLTYAGHRSAAEACSACSFFRPTAWLKALRWQASHPAANSAA